MIGFDSKQKTELMGCRSAELQSVFRNEVKNELI
jgi:hypothetical protein